MTDQFNIGTSLIRTLRYTGKPLSYGINCFGDGYCDQSGIDTTSSVNYIYDPRFAFEPSRSGNENIGADNTQSLTGWTPFSNGTASVSVYVDPNNPVTPNTGVFQFSTGSTLGSVAGVQKNFGTIPDSAFSIGIHIDIESTGTNAADAFVGQVASVSGYNMMFQVFSGNVQIFQDGAWQTMFAYGGGNWYTEWWFDAVQVSADKYTVNVYAGTQLLASRTGNLPGGGNPGLIVLQKNSGATANQNSRVAYVNIGTSQAADNMTLISQPAQYLTTSPTTANLIALVEDTSLMLDVNNNINGFVSQNGGVTWEPVTFTDMGVFGLGVVDDTKPVHMLVAQHTFTNSGAMAPTYKIESSGNWWFSIMGAYLEWA